MPGELVLPKPPNETTSQVIFEYTFLSNPTGASVAKVSNVPKISKSMKRYVSLFGGYSLSKTHADDSVLLDNLPTPAPSPAHYSAAKHSRSGSTASSGDFPNALPSPYSILSHPLSSTPSQGYYSPDSQLTQSAYDATLPATSSWNVTGYTESVDPHYNSKKRAYEEVNGYFADVKRHKFTPVYDSGNFTWFLMVLTMKRYG